MNQSGNNPVRFLLLTLNPPPPFIGGSRVYIHELLAHLPPQSAQVLTVSKGDPASEREFDIQQPYRTMRLPVVFSYGTQTHPSAKIRLLLLCFRAMWNQTRRARTDIVVLENIYILGILTRLVTMLRGLPYIVICFGEELSQALQNTTCLRDKIRYRIYSSTLRGAASIIAVSGQTAEWVTQFGVQASRITVIYPPTSLPGKQPTADSIEQFRSSHGLQEERILASVGRLIPRKGHSSLIRAMPAVIEQCPDVVLVIAGTGPLENDLSRLARELGVEKHVRFLGRIEQEARDLLYASCELFVLPNRTLPNGDAEGYGIVFNEASAFGKPVIGGRSGGTSDAIIHEVTGLLVDGEQPGDIASAIIRLLKDRGFMEKLGWAGQERVRTACSPQRASDQFLALAQSVSRTRAESSLRIA